MKERRIQRGLVAAAITLTLCACGEGENSRSSDGQEPVVSTTGVVLEIGATVAPDQIELVAAELGHALLPANGGVDTLIVDGPNADVLDSFHVPGTTSSGQLDTISENTTARTRDVEELGPRIEGAVSSVFSIDASFDDGRDIVGALERMASREPSRIVLMLTSGGIHRTSSVDFLVEIPDPERLDIDADVELTILGVGDVPVAEGAVPSQAFTSKLLSYWLGVCELHGPKCEVVR